MNAWAQLGIYYCKNEEKQKFLSKNRFLVKKDKKTKNCLLDTRPVELMEFYFNIILTLHRVYQIKK